MMIIMRNMLFVFLFKNRSKSKKTGISNAAIINAFQPICTAEPPKYTIYNDEKVWLIEFGTETKIPKVMNVIKILFPNNCFAYPPFCNFETPSTFPRGSLMVATIAINRIVVYTIHKFSIPTLAIIGPAAITMTDHPRDPQILNAPNLWSVPSIVFKIKLLLWANRGILKKKKINIIMIIIVIE